MKLIHANSKAESLKLVGILGVQSGGSYIGPSSPACPPGSLVENLSKKLLRNFWNYPWAKNKKLTELEALSSFL